MVEIFSEEAFGCKRYEDKREMWMDNLKLA